MRQNPRLGGIVRPHVARSRLRWITGLTRQRPGFLDQGHGQLDALPADEGIARTSQQDRDHGLGAAAERALW